MGRQTGLIKVSGNIGGVSFYKSNGQDLARVANGPSKEKILHDDNFIRTRENNSEFGGSATVAKALRMSLIGSMHTMADNRIASRLTALFKEVCVRSTGVRGQRPITISANSFLLDNLELNKKTSFSSVFNGAYGISVSAGRDSTTITTIGALPQNVIHAPAGATHFKLISAIGVVSDYTYNPTSGHYEPTDPALNLLGASSQSAMTGVNSNSPFSFTLTSTLPGTPAMTPTANLVQCIGIEFYQQIGPVYYLLAQGNCMKIEQVY